MLQNRERYALETSANSAPFPLNHHISAEIASAKSLENCLPRWLTSAGTYPALSSPSLSGLWETCSKSEEVPCCHTGSSCNPTAEVQQRAPLQGAFIFQKWSSTVDLHMLNLFFSFNYQCHLVISTQKAFILDHFTQAPCRQGGQIQRVHKTQQ